MEDACGNIGTCVQLITVADTTAPVIICPASVVINCKDNTLPSANGKATATDYCTASLFIKITPTKMILARPVSAMAQDTSIESGQRRTSVEMLQHVRRPFKS
ncbi:MAG: hypothetical protein IPP15_07160 [Saprospiraceae bacterium]|uniref:HYR domain-containing protein n=1 Tax=Candidatus Opimibacter skivensis TaxID=2982028 RepID=A0A9D7SUN5_9BACT|nr:hypothetical protein [Candidatus Opimibacter skivensis]